MDNIITTKPNRTKLELILPGEVVSAGKGEFYLIRQDIEKFCYDAENLTKRYQDMFNLSVDHIKLNNDFKSILNVDPQEIVFLDIETTGLSNTPLFLIGLLYFDGDKLVIDQLFARDYSEEAHLLHYFSEFMPKFNVLVTFNGKSFDIPFIRDRMIFHRKFANWTYNHIDILLHSRRRWRGIFPDCKLQTLEYYVCQRRRIDDVPSSLVPEIYHDFVRNGNTEYILGVLNHNVLDLITLFELTTVLVVMETD
ncbi:MAG: ribonuclease H-like domain-containing protein [Candidatus Poribacteria bacterium]